MLSKFSKFFKIWRRLGWFLVLARRLGQGDLARGVRAGRVAESLAWIKNCDGFYNGVAQMASGAGRGLLLNNGVALRAKGVKIVTLK